MRRDLGADQRAIIIAKLRLPVLKAEAKERQKAGLKRGQALPRPAKSGGTAQGEARDVAAGLAGVSHTKIDAAAKLALERPDLHEEVKAGKMTLTGVTRRYNIIAAWPS